jgi:hypothetical protein
MSPYGRGDIEQEGTEKTYGIKQTREEGDKFKRSGPVTGFICSPDQEAQVQI